MHGPWKLINALDRYHLYASYGCRECCVSLQYVASCTYIQCIAWATRTLIVRKLKGLEDIIGIVQTICVRHLSHVVSF